MDGVDHITAHALLQWQVELGADEAMCDAPVNRFELPQKAAKAPATPPPAPLVTEIDPVAEARQAAAACATLSDLQAAMTDYPHCDLKKGAQNLVFSDGQAGAAVMILGEAPGRDEDIQGRPFVGRAGQLLDKMFAAIGLARAADQPAQALYISNIMPWRPPQNRDPSAEEIAMMMPFVTKHVELAAPRVLVLMGNTPCQAVLGRRGITRLRGQWQKALDLPVMPMFHPAYLLRNPAAKREAWADLLHVQHHLKEDANVAD